MRIHSIISITQLESISDRLENLYARTFIQLLSFVQKEDDIDSKFAIKYLLYEIERLFERWKIGRNVKYLIYWKNNNNEHNVWYSIYIFSQTQDLINEYDVHIIIDFIYDRRDKKVIKKTFISVTQT